MRNGYWTLFSINWPFLSICNLHPARHKLFPFPDCLHHTPHEHNQWQHSNTNPSFFASQYVLALHKDPDNLNKLCPIGIGTALQCLAASLITTIYATNFATYLIPNGQFGIACPGGLNFIYHTMQAQMELLLTDPNHSSHALLLLNIVNMFNAISQEACHMTLTNHPIFSALLPFFDLLYTEANQCWVRMADGSFTTILQHEGFAQGCPLSPFFACVILAILTQQIIEELKQWLKKCIANLWHRLKQTPATTSLLNDTSIILEYADIPWFIKQFTKLGRPLNIILNPTKTKILTSLTNKSPLASNTIPDTDKQHLQEALSLLSNDPKQLEGIWFLGLPLGSQSFTNKYLTNQANIFKHTLQQLSTCITNKQTQGVLLCYCTLPSLNHLLTANVYHNTNFSNPPPLHNWQSPFVTNIKNSVKTFLCYHTQQANIPTDSLTIFYLPISLRGCRFCNPSTFATPSLIMPLTQSICYAIQGITLTNATQCPLPPTHQHFLANWATSQQCIHLLF